ncbi:MAG: methyltransferase family protein [Fidelibacterota bacterium]
MAVLKRIFHGSAFVFYLLIGLEIVIMISPFAAYFYAAYGPFLNFLHGSTITSWLTGFFLPHAVVSQSSFINFITGFGRTLFTLGILAFFIPAFQIYSKKIFRKGVVSGGVYRFIRHPQYLFLAIAGFGLLLFWPRFFILVIYISMLYVYYLLARYEEYRMIQKYGDSYRDYMERTAMFIPGEPGAKIYSRLFGWIGHGNVRLAAAYVFTLLISTGVGFGLREISKRNISILWSPENNLTAISIYPQSPQSMKETVDVIMQDDRVDSLILKYRRDGHRGFMTHIMPSNYIMRGLFADFSRERAVHSGKRYSSLSSVLRFVFPFFFRSAHGHMMGQEGMNYQQAIFSQLTYPNGEFAPYESALNLNVMHLPIMRVDIDKSKREVLKVEETEPKNFWGQMPMPVF